MGWVEAGSHASSEMALDRFSSFEGLETSLPSAVRWLQADDSGDLLEAAEALW